MQDIWANILNRASEVGETLITARNQPKPAPVAKPAAATAPAWQKWAIGGGIAVAIVAVILVITRRK